MLSLAAALRQVKLSGCGRAGAEGSRHMLDFAIERGAIMSRNLPVDTVLAFLEQINARNVDGLCALMTDDYVILNGLGNRMQGRESMRKVGPDTFACFLIIKCRTRTFFRRAMWWRHLAPPKNARRQGGTSEGKPLERVGGPARCRARWLDRGMAGVRGQSEREKDYGCAKSVGR